MADQQGKIDPRAALAAERTLLAWIRTALAMMGFGFVVARFGVFLRELAPNVENPPGYMSSVVAGIALVFAGVATVIAGVWDYKRIVRLMHAMEPLDSRVQPAVIVAYGLAAIGVGLSIYLLLR